MFYVTNMWVTQTGETHVHRVRFEKADLTSLSWWAPTGTTLPSVKRDFTKRALVDTCSTCSQTFPQIYANGWTCCNTKCQQFTRMVSVPDLNPAFLAERSDHATKPKAPFPVVPWLPKNDPYLPFCSYTRAKGIVCPKCHGCSSRKHWTHWACETEGCDFIYEIPHQVLSHRVFIDRLEEETFGDPLPVDHHLFPVTQIWSRCLEGYRQTVFELLPGHLVAHIQGNMHTNSEPRGPNDIFLGLQGTRNLLEYFSTHPRRHKILVRTSIYHKPNSTPKRV